MIIINVKKNIQINNQTTTKPSSSCKKVNENKFKQTRKKNATHQSKTKERNNLINQFSQLVYGYLSYKRPY
jgi:hypothetical protein